MALAVPACIWGFTGFESCLSLKDLCTLSLTRRDWQEPVKALYNSPCARQLVEALATSVPGLATALTTGDSPSELLQHLRRLVFFLQQRQPWGPALAATPGLLHDYDQLFTVSDLPSNVIKHFVQHVGVHISYQQMITAAYNKVAGLEVWVRHQQRHGIRKNMPDTISLLCYGHFLRQPTQWLETWRPTNPKDLVDMVQVMLNCSFYAADWYELSSVVVVMISQIEDSASVLHLLSTAVVRGHRDVVKGALEIPVVQQFDAAATMQLMLTDVVAPDEEVCTIVSPRKRDMMHLLVQLPAASYVAKRDVMFLLERSVATGNDAAVEALCTLAAIKTTSVRTVVKLMSRAIRLRLDDAVAALCSLPAAKKISDFEWITLATAAVQDRLKYGSAGLCKLPAAAHAAHETVAELLSSAIPSELYAAVEALVSLPAAACIPPEQASEITQEFVTQVVKDPEIYIPRVAEKQLVDILKAFSKLKAVQDMSFTELLELFSMAMHATYYPASGGVGQPIVKWLAKLPAASSIPADVMKQQMQEAVQQQNDYLLTALCELPAALHIGADPLLQMLNIARTEDSDISRYIQRLLFKMAVHMQLSHSQLMAVMLAAVSTGHCLSDFNGKRGWTKQLTTSNVADLLAAAVQTNNCDNVERLCSLAAAASISSSVLAELLSAVVDRHNCIPSTLRSLCSLPGARQIPQGVAAALVCKAEESGNGGSMQALLPLQRRQSERLRCRGQ